MSTTIDDVTEAMLKDKDKSQLMATRLCKFKPNQLKWAVWEKEFYGAPFAVDTWGNYITTATSQFPKTGDKKIVFFTDNKTSIAKWQTLHVPDGPLSNLCAKHRRLLHWCHLN